MVPQHFRIFLASPSDVTKERQAIFETVARLPYDIALRGKVTTEVVAWDGPFGSIPLLATVDPQSAVSYGLPLPSQCDVVVVILFSRLGTPLSKNFWKDNGTRAVTGTEWEYEDAISANALSGIPEVLVYRRTGEANFDLTKGEQAAAEAARNTRLVDEFFVKMRSEERGYNSYQTHDELADMVSGAVKLVIVRRLEQPDVNRARLLAFLDQRGEAVSLAELIDFAGSRLEEPHLRVLAVDEIIQLYLPTEASTNAKPIQDLAAALMATRHADIGKAGVRLATSLIRSGSASLNFLRFGAMNPRWEIKSATVASTRELLGSEVIDVYEWIGDDLSYWRPVQTITDRLTELSPELGQADRARAIRILEALLSNPRQSEKQQKRLQGAIARLREEQGTGTEAN